MSFADAQLLGARISFSKKQVVLSIWDNTKHGRIDIGLGKESWIKPLIIF